MTESRSPPEPQISNVVVAEDADWDYRHRRPTARIATAWWFALAALVVAGVALLLWWWRQPPPPPTAPPVAASTAPAPADSAPAVPAIRHPIDEVPKHAGLEEMDVTAPAMPSFADSDASLLGALTGVPGGGAFERFVHPRDLARRFVATVDNLPRASVATQVMVVKPIEGAFDVAGAEGHRTISAENAARYAPFVRLASALDTKRLVALYVRFYPWFQQAYVELGYPTGYFNDRLIEVIDNLLAAPEVTGPVALVQPRVLYHFADPRLEALSAGQKMMIRMGGENAAQARAKLRELRRALTGALPPS
jgi:hypothetical protein